MRDVKEVNCRIVNLEKSILELHFKCDGMKAYVEIDFQNRFTYLGDAFRDHVINPYRGRLIKPFSIYIADVIIGASPELCLRLNVRQILFTDDGKYTRLKEKRKQKITNGFSFLNSPPLGNTM